MALAATLADLREELRAELGHTLDGTQGLNMDVTLNKLINRSVRLLWVEFDWPDKEVRETVDLNDDTRYYNYPGKIQPESMNAAYAQDGSGWRKMGYRITPEDLSLYNSDEGETGYPPQKWQHAVDDQDTPTEDVNKLEVWPVPGTGSSGSKILVVGNKSAPVLSNDVDVCQFDMYAIVLRAAAELALRQGLGDADAKLAVANRYVNRLLAQMGAGKRAPFIMGGGVNYHPTYRHGRYRPGIDYIPS